MRPMNWVRRMMILAATVLLVVAVAWGGSGEDEPKTTSGGATSGGGMAGGLTVVGKDNTFEPANVTVKVNQESHLTFDNKGAAVHNWHVLNVKDTAGNDVAAQLLPAGQSETLTFTLATPGTYAFQCDTHPAEMKGTLTVQ